MMKVRIKTLGTSILGIGLGVHVHYAICHPWTCMKRIHILWVGSFYILMMSFKAPDELVKGTLVYLDVRPRSLRLKDADSWMFAGRGEDVKLSMESHHAQESVNFRLRISDDEILRILNIIRTSAAEYHPQPRLATDTEEDWDTRLEDIADSSIYELFL